MPKSFCLLAFSIALAVPAFAEDLLGGGGFETPIVEDRATKEKGGDPTKGANNSPWVGFDHKPGNKGGTIAAGIAHGVAHGGLQSTFVQFSHVTLPYQNASLQTRIVPIAAGGEYRARIWGRVDAKNPIKLETRTPYLKVQIDFFSKDGSEPAGDAVYVVQPIPGSKNRAPFFLSERWKEFVAVGTAPDDAGFAQITWRCETSTEEGETNGIFFLDDASFDGPQAPDPNAKPAPPAAEPDEMTGETNVDPNAEPTTEIVAPLPRDGTASATPAKIASPPPAAKASATPAASAPSKQ